MFVALDLFRGEERGHELASIVAASGLVYLGAAASGPWLAWPVFVVSVIIITAAKLGLIGFDATWPLLAAAALFLGYGVLRGVTRPASGLPLQAIAMVVFGAAAGVALFVDEVAGAYMVAAGLLAHAGWDVWHHRTNRVVPRSMAEFCFVLDVLLAVAIAIATARA